MGNSDQRILPVFIGGTGRSGTTIFSRILSQNETVYSFPQELRFITDPDGILSLKYSLVQDWSKFQADLSIDRFLVLLNNLKFKYKYKGTYPNHALAEIVGKNFYENWVNDISNQLITFNMKSGWAARVTVFQKGILKGLGKNAFTNLFLKNSFYCPPLSENEFNQIFEKFIMDFFNQSGDLYRAKVVIDHTPSSLIHFNIIHDILPQAKLIHIYRDPHDVVCSYKTKDWGSPSIRENVAWINDVLTRWEKIKEQLKPESFIELQFESLINNPEIELKRVCSFLNIEYHDSLLNLDVSKHNIGRWKKELNDQEKSIIREYLKDHIINLGYQH
jgi:hypothetical protein